MGQITSNALSWVCFRNAGGWKRSLIISGVYLLAIFTVFLLVFSAQGGDRTGEFMSGLARFCLLIQAGVLFIFTCLAISNTMQLDRKTGMIESHRLMPIDPRLAILGYIAGCATSPLIFALVNFAIGLFATASASLPVTWWIGANLILLSYCAFTWSIAALGGALGNFMGLLLLIPLGMVLISGGALGAIMPGILLLASPVSGKTIWDASGLEGEHLPIFLLALVMQVALATIFIHAAARRFRHHDLPAFSGLLGFLLTALFALILLLGIKFNQSLNQNRFRDFRQDMNLYIASSLFVLLALGLLTLSSHVAGDYLQRCHLPRSTRAKTDALLVGGLLLCIVAFCLLLSSNQSAILLTLLSCLVFLLTTLFWARYLYRHTLNLGLLCLAIGLLQLLPLIVGAMFRDANGNLLDLAKSTMQVSIFLSLPAIWSNHSSDFYASTLPLQLLLLLLPGALLYWDPRRRLARPSIAV